jgi:hypothetical protein
VDGSVIPLAMTIAFVGAVLGGMCFMSFSGLKPARVDLVDGSVHITMQGLMPLYALRGRLTVPLADLRGVHADRSARSKLGGFKFGTCLPGVMWAGTFLRAGGRGREFYAVYRAKEALVLDLRPGRGYRRIIVEIDDLDATAAAISSALAGAR